MERSCYSVLDHWYRKKPRKPLILRGARQVGKSTAVRKWAESRGLVLFELNLERHRSLEALFASNDVALIIKEIELLLSKQALNSENSLLFLDEIQATPSAIAALRYFYEDHPSLAVIAAGSLLEFTLAKHQFSMPVGRIEYCFLGPMTFKEFLLALGQELLIEFIESFQWGQEYFSDQAHLKLLEYMRRYMLIGGMPEAVQQYVSNLNSVDELQIADDVMQSQSSILGTYQDDFSKYCKPHEFNYLYTVFSQIPQSIGDKIKYSNIDSEAKSRDIKNAINLLLSANVLSAAYHTAANGIPLRAEQDASRYKLFFLDIGLLNRASGVAWISPEELVSTRLINEGPLAEQFIAQHLLRLWRYGEKPSLNYWIREKSQSNAEIDFLWQNNREIVPIEVKSGKSGSLKSLLQFVFNKKSSYAYRFDLNKPSIQYVQHLIPTSKGKTEQVCFTLHSLPLYMIEEMPRLLMATRGY